MQEYSTGRKSSGFFYDFQNSTTSKATQLYLMRINRGNDSEGVAQVSIDFAH